MKLNLNFVREQFPSLKGEWTYFDNAGGSQTLKAVVDRISEFYTTSDVQLGATYEPSQVAGRRVQEGYQFVAGLLNAKYVSEVIFGASTTMLLRQLSFSLVQTLEPGDELIVTNSEHEANAGPWVNLEKQGMKIKFWKINQKSLKLDIEDLKKLMTPKTRFVSLTHASNILGTINPIKEIAEVVHQYQAYLCVDAVAYAPHRLPDVQDLDVDFYVINLVRDGRGVAWSLMKPYKKDPTAGVQKDLKPKPVWRTALFWLVINALSEVSTGRVFKVKKHFVRYEDFVEDTEGTLKKIGDFTGIDFHYVEQAIHAGEALSVGHTIAGNRVRMTGVIRLNPDYGWVKLLPQKDKRIFWSIAGFLAAKYGYKKDMSV